MPERPNIILAVFDTARADAFEPYGAQLGTTPAFANLATSGELHRRMQATACWTVPSHASMFTGLLPRAAGLARAPGGAPRGCAPELAKREGRLLPAVMRGAGYETAGISTNLWIAEGSGFDLGFDHFHTIDGGRQGSLVAGGRGDHLRWLAQAAAGRADDGAAEASQVLESQLAKAGEAPFFWFVNLVEAHSPYLPPRPYNPLGPLSRMRAAEEARRHLTMSEIWRACAGGFDVPAGAIERMRALYTASIRQLDDWLTRLLESLDAAGRLDETLVVVTSDHGENIGEGGLMGHAYSLDQRLTHVPFVASGPGAPPDAGLTSLSSLPRMLSEAAGITDHPYADDDLPPGIAVAQFDPPAGPDHPRIAEALSAWGLGEEAIPRFTSRLTSATDGHLKLIRSEQGELFFDLDADPLEQTGVASPADLSGTADAGGSGAVAAEALRAAVAGADRATGSAPQTDGATEAPAEISDAEREELERRMRLLGYM